MFFVFGIAYSQPELYVRKESQHLGTHAQNQLIEGSIKIKNKGDQPLVIAGASNYIGNVTAVFSPVRLDPEQSSEIKILTGTGKTIGTLSRSLDLTTNIGNQRIYVKFDVIEKLDQPSNYSLKLESEHDSLLILKLNGWFRTYGDCDVAEAILGLTQVTNEETEGYEIDQMDCGQATIVLKNYEKRLNKFKLHKTYRRSLPKGHYRFFTYDNNYKKIYSEIFQIENDLIFTR
jgi:hypothetical protein